MNNSIPKVKWIKKYIRQKGIIFNGSTYFALGQSSFTSDWEYEFVIKRTSNSTAFVSFQNPNVSSNNIGMFCNYTGYSIQFGSSSRISLPTNNTDYFTIKINKTGVYKDGVLYESWSTTPDSFIIARSLILGGAYDDLTRCFSGKIKRFTITSPTNGLVANYIATKRVSDNVLGFYDTVGDNFYTPTSGTVTSDGNDSYSDVPQTYTHDGITYNVPSDVKIIDYAQFDGSTYVTTGITTKASAESVESFRTVVDFEPTSFSGTNYVGVCGAGVAYGYGYYTGGSSKMFRPHALTDSSQSGYISIIANTKYKVDDTLGAGSGGTYVCNINGKTLSGYPAVKQSLPYLLGWAYNNTSENKFIGKIYRCAVYDGTTIKGLFIPAVLNNIVGFYDFISSTFLTPTEGTLTGYENNGQQLKYICSKEEN